MQKNLQDYRKSYGIRELKDQDLPSDPLYFFENWFSEMEMAKTGAEINTMTVSSMGFDGFPKSRIVLLKSFNSEGFVFYTNYNSEKGKSIIANPKVCLSFFWPNLERQVIIKGIAEKTSKENSIAYFKTRPRGSQLGAWASNQGQEIASREILELKLLELNEKYKDNAIPKPPYWGGFIVKPQNFEFWQGRENRLHDRFLYDKIEEGNWKVKRLAP